MGIKPRRMAAVLLAAGLLTLSATQVFAQQKNPERNVYYLSLIHI